MLSFPAPTWADVFHFPLAALVATGVLWVLVLIIDMLLFPGFRRPQGALHRLYAHFFLSSGQSDELAKRILEENREFVTSCVGMFDDDDDVCCGNAGLRRPVVPSPRHAPRVLGPSGSAITAARRLFHRSGSRSQL